MAIRLIVTDLDGTLMAPDHVTVTERTKKALLDAHNRGVKTAIATGRTISLIGMVTQQVDFIDYVIYSNGAAVYDRVNKRLIYTAFFPTQKALEITAYLESEPLFYEMYANGWSYVPKEKASLFDGGALPPEFIEKITENVNFVEDMAQVVRRSDVEKFNVSSMAPDRAAAITERLKHFDGADWTSSLPDSNVQNQMELMRSGVHKGSAVSGMCQALDILPEEVMAFGDAENDCTMLRFAGWSFAMGNACDACRAAAKYQTASNAEDGLAQAVEKYVLHRGE
ncbi:MAG: HAD family phosphatase [Clostridiales bacterium]|nr:HAD family phosphatase [Clostridiales bacterium]